MVNGSATIGLFQGMFEGNILTFNPGLRRDGSPLDEFTDIREIRESLVAGGVELQTDTDPRRHGSGSHHVPRSGRERGPHRPVLPQARYRDRSSVRTVTGDDSRYSLTSTPFQNAT